MNKQEIMDDLLITGEQLLAYSGVFVEKLFCACILKLPEEQRISVLTDFINLRDILFNGEYLPASEPTGMPPCGVVDSQQPHAVQPLSTAHLGGFSGPHADLGTSA